MSEVPEPFLRAFVRRAGPVVGMCDRCDGPVFADEPSISGFTTALEGGVRETRKVLLHEGCFRPDRAPR